MLVEAPVRQACPVCRSGEIDCAVGGASDHLTGEPFKILRCRDCAVSFTDPIPKDLGRYYHASYRGYSALTGLLLRAVYRLRMKHWLKKIPKQGYALEIGCGRGIMLDVLRRSGWRVLGIERTPEVARYARETFGLDVTTDGIECLPERPTFDLIYLFNVLEHLPDPLQAVQEAAKRLKPGGFLIVTVPDYHCWQSRFGKELWVHLDPPRHLFHFTRSSLSGLFQRCGLQTVEISYAGLEHDLFGWLQTAVNKFLGDYNALTRYLMGIDKLNWTAFLSVLLAGLIAPFCLVLCGLSWLFNKGALMQATARRLTP